MKLHLHWCLFDRECRDLGAPRRVYLHWGRHTWYVGEDVGHFRRDS